MDALAHVCVWECERAIKQAEKAKAKDEEWETCFGAVIRLVLHRLPPAALQNASLKRTYSRENLNPGEWVKPEGEVDAIKVPTVRRTQFPFEPERNFDIGLSRNGTSAVEILTEVDHLEFRHSSRCVHAEIAEGKMWIVVTPYSPSDTVFVRYWS